MVTDTEPDIRPSTAGAPLSPATDAAVIERSWHEPERFAAVCDRYYAEVHGYVARRLGRSLADDVASETFVIAFDRRRRYDLAYPNARPWLYGIASNLIARHRRAEVRQYRALARAGVAADTDGHADHVAGRASAARAPGRRARGDLRARPRGAPARRVGAAQLRGGGAGPRHRRWHGAIATASGAAQDARGTGKRGRRAMNDLHILNDAWGAPEATSPDAHARARAALLARATPRAGARRPLLGVRVAGACAVAVALAVGLIVVESLGGTGSDGRPTSVVGLPAVPVASAEVLERAAVAAEQQPFTAPHDDQWIYIEEKVAGTDFPTPEIQRQWHRADGGGFAWIDESGKLRVQMTEAVTRRSGHPIPDPLGSYKALAALPTDPDALLRWADGLHMTNGNSSHGAVLYLLFIHILRENVLPPDLQAAIFRALERVPGVTLDSTVDVLGHPAYALGQTDDWLHEEILVDKSTYAYRGTRSTVVKDATIDPAKAGNSTGKVQKGHVVVAARLVTAVVDQAGQRP